jgi:transcriptional regulator with GAF, ATPase, and Fis domain
MQPEWADAEGIESFAGQPLTFNGQVLGVVAFFSRRQLTRQDLDWLRVFADHAAVAIANTRAFEEIARLKEHAERERDYLREAVRRALQHGEIIAESPAMQRVLSQVEAVAQSDASVLVLGESGVGKELIATAIHDSSRRRDAPFVKVNCAAVPRELFESEFFGHVRGAFSGAARDRQGRFLLADRGTLLLDEVGEIPLELQAKLLRVLQERKFEAVGDDRTRSVDVRIISTTNRPLELEVERGTFRRDLYYRLGVLPIEIPALRDRKEDILPMARRFLRETARRLNVPEPELGSEDREALLKYHFPGNVRELQNVIERAVVLQGRAQSLRLQIGRGGEAPPSSAPSAAPHADSSSETEVLSEQQLRNLERENMQRALRLCNWQVSGPDGAARLLGVAPSTFSYRMKQLGILRPSSNSSSSSVTGS